MLDALSSTGRMHVVHLPATAILLHVLATVIGGFGDLNMEICDREPQPWTPYLRPWPARCCRSARRRLNGSFQGTTVIRTIALAGKSSANADVQASPFVRLLPVTFLSSCRQEHRDRESRVRHVSGRVLSTYRFPSNRRALYDSFQSKIDAPILGSAHSETRYMTAFNGFRSGRAACVTNYAREQQKDRK
jgi:hypothetical protein